MDSYAEIVKRYCELEAAARETLLGPDHEAIAERVAEELDIPVVEVRTAMIDLWLRLR